MDMRWDGGDVLNILSAGKQTGWRDASPAADGQIQLGMFTRHGRPSEASARVRETPIVDSSAVAEFSQSGSGIMNSRCTPACCFHHRSLLFQLWVILIKRRTTATQDPLCWAWNSDWWARILCWYPPLIHKSEIIRKWNWFCKQTRQDRRLI